MSGIVYFFPSRHLTNWWWLLFSRSVVSSSLRPHGLQHIRLPRLSPSPGVCSNSCPLSRSCHPSHRLPFLSLPAFNLSQHQCIFQRVSSSRQVAKLLEIQLHLSPSNEYSGLISFRMDWFDLLAVQGILRHLLRHHSSKVLVKELVKFYV